MDELTLKPVPKKEDAESVKEHKEKDSFEMAPISLKPSKKADETEAAFEELNSKDIQTLMQQEKLERQKAKEAAEEKAAQKEANVPSPVKPQGSEGAKNKITEIMLTPPDADKKDEKPENKAPEQKKAPSPQPPVNNNDKKQENKQQGGNKNSKNGNNNNNNGNNKNNNNKNNTSKPENKAVNNAPEVKKGIEEISIPDAMMKDSKKAPESAPKKTPVQDNIDSIPTKKPVLVDVDANVAHAVGGMSFNEEYALLAKKEEQDSLNPDEARRLKICRLIDMRRKGKPFTDVAKNNFQKFMEEERRAGHDVSTFEAAIADIAAADAASGKKASNPASANPAPINIKTAAPKPHTAEKKKESAPAKAPAREKTGSDNKVLFIVIAIIAVLLVGMLIIIFAGKGNGNKPIPDETSTTTSEVTTASEPETTTKQTAETTPIISAGNLTKATVLEVISGDTFKVLLKDNSQATVKLIGAVAPKDNEYYAKESLEYAKNVLDGKVINIEFDEKLTDEDFNILAYVWYNDGKTLFNDEVLLSGYAKANLDEDNVKFNEEFEKVETEAKEGKKGLWGYKAPTYVQTTKATTKPAVDPNKMVSAPYVSRNLKVFHKNTCPLAYDEKYGKAVYTFESREEAIKYGCSPCSQCQP
ncbi:MAG: thermonuclease family protein [Oscillospiraceae bacterium]